MQRRFVRVLERPHFAGYRNGSPVDQRRETRLDFDFSLRREARQEWNADPDLRDPVQPVFGAIVEVDAAVDDLDIAHRKAGCRTIGFRPRLSEEIRNVITLVRIAYEVQRRTRYRDLADDGRPAEKRGELSVDVEIPHRQHGRTFATISDDDVAQRGRQRE